MKVQRILNTLRESKYASPSICGEGPETVSFQGSLLPSVWGFFRPGDPCPGLLTEAEAVRYLRLDQIGIKNPAETLRRYRKAGRLKGTQVSKRVFYQRKNLDQFLDTMTETNPR